MPEKKSAAAHDHFKFDSSAAALMSAADAYVMGGDWDAALESLTAVLEEAADHEPAEDFRQFAGG
jgi:thioredoxin-like negative regulator of GroEL